MEKKSSLLIIGHKDAAENALYRHFALQGWQVFSSARGALDVLDRLNAEAFFKRVKPEYVILGSVRSGVLVPTRNFLRNLFMRTP